MRRSAHRGLTLVELMVSCSLVIFAVAAASAVLLSQSKAMYGSDLTRTANASTRDALLQLETALRVAGWGVDPRWALDFRYRCPTLPTLCHDSTTGPDELAFVSRNPNYRWIDDTVGSCVTPGGCFTGNAWSVASVNLASSPKTASIVVPAGTVLHKGRVMMVTCQGGQNPVMVTLNATITGTGATEVLTPEPTTFLPYNDPASLVACHGLVGSAVFLVDRYRYYVDTIAGFPWLMLDTGLDLDRDGNLPLTDADDLIPVAKNVEDLQVAYTLNASATITAPDANADWIIGNRPGTQEAPLLTAASPNYSTASNDASRFTLHPANVRGVRISLILRSDRADPSQARGWAGDTLTSSENRTTTLSGGGFRRYAAQTQITLRNLESRSPFIF